MQGNHGDVAAGFRKPAGGGITLTGDVAVMVGAVVVLQEGNQGVEEVVWAEEDELLQHVCGHKGTPC